MSTLIPRSTNAPRAVLIAAVLGTALVYMSDDMLNLAVPSLARELGATMTDVQWVLNSYYVSLASCVLIVGSAGDIVGHRRVFTIGLVAFSLGALICATAPSVLVLVIGRGAQGIGGSMLLTAGLALVTRSNAPDERARAIGAFLGLVAAVPALGPFVSGALVDLLSWRWLFIVPLALPLTALVTTRLYVPETPLQSERHPDLRGAAAAFITLSALSVALIDGPGHGIGPRALAPLLVAIAAAVGFVLIERRSLDPMLPFSLFRRPIFVGGNLIWLLASMTSWGGVFFLALALQTFLGVRPLAAGLVLIPVYMLMMVGAPLATRLAERVGARRLIPAGLSVYAVGLWLLSRVSPASPVVPDVLFGVAVFGVGMATFTPSLAAITLGSLDEDQQGIASGLNNAMGQLGGLLAVVVFPALAGLAGVTIGGADFVAGYAAALQAAAVIAVAAVAVAIATFARW